MNGVSSADHSGAALRNFYVLKVSLLSWPPVEADGRSQVATIIERAWRLLGGAACTE